MVYTRQLFIVGAVLLGSMAPGKLMADPMGCAGNTTNSGLRTEVTGSCSETDLLVSTTATNSVSAFATTITAELNGGPLLFDESFNLPYASAAVQAAVLQAESDLRMAGANGISGPMLVSSTVSTSSSVSTTMGAPVDTGTTLYGTTTTFGPGAIFVGELGLCQGLVAIPSGESPVGCSGQGTLFSILTGQLDININADEVFDVTQLTTTTNTTLTSQTYNLEGVAGDSPVPEPGSLMLLGTGMVGMAEAMRRRLTREKFVAGE